MLFADEELKRLNQALTSDGGFSAVEYSYGSGTEDYDPMQPTEDERGSLVVHGWYSICSVVCSYMQLKTFSGQNFSLHVI